MGRIAELIKQAAVYFARRKTAAVVERGNILTRAPGHALGGLLNTMQLTPLLTKDLSAYREGDIDDDREVVQAMEELYPHALQDTKVIHGGGTRLLDTLKRHFTNKRTGIVGKTIGLPSTFLSAGIGGLLRQPLYSPYSDEVYSPWDNPGVLSHELGHAIDMNSDKPIPEKEKFLAEQWRKLKHDVYPLARILPGGSLFTEGRASPSTRSRKSSEYARPISASLKSVI